MPQPPPASTGLGLCPGLPLRPDAASPPPVAACDATCLSCLSAALADKTTALREVLDTAHLQKQQAVEALAARVEQAVLPLLQRLRETVPAASRPLVDHVTLCLQELTSGRADPLARLSARLSPTELRLCRLIRRALTSKEIAQVEGVSADTVETHRRNIRRKLSLANEQVNLTTYLQSLPEIAGPSESSTPVP